MDNPLNKIIGWSIGDLNGYIEFHNIQVTPEQKREFINSHEPCMMCGAWYKDTDFSSFSLGQVICKNCDH